MTMTGVVRGSGLTSYQRVLDGTHSVRLIQYTGDLSLSRVRRICVGDV